jgi:hypothetical protein
MVAAADASSGSVTCRCCRHAPRCFSTAYPQVHSTSALAACVSPAHACEATSACKCSSLQRAHPLHASKVRPHQKWHGRCHALLTAAPTCARRFVNDVFACAGELLRLLLHDTDVACGMDWAYIPKNGTCVPKLNFYDYWWDAGWGLQHACMHWATCGHAVRTAWCSCGGTRQKVVRQPPGLQRLVPPAGTCLHMALRRRRRMRTRSVRAHARAYRRAGCCCDVA